MRFGTSTPWRLALLLAAGQALSYAAPARAEADDATGVSSLVVVGGDRDYPPYEFIDRSGKPAGYNVDLTRAIAETMGMTVEFRLGGWAEMRRALKEGRIDVLQGISYSEERAKELDFSAPHTIVHHSIFARHGTPPVRSLDELRGRKVVVFGAGIMDDTLTQRGITTDRTDTPADALRMLASGRYDYAAVATLPGMYISRELQLTNIEPVANRVATHRYGYAVKKGNTELLARFNEGLAILKKTGRYQAIQDRWLGVMEPQGVPWRIIARYGAIAIVPLLLVLGGTVLWSRSLQKLVAQRTESLARQQQQLVQAGKMAALGTLVSGVAHEINNPNGFILLNMPTLREAYLDAAEILDAHHRAHGEFTLGGLPYSRMRQELPHMLEEMLEGARRIKHIVEDLKDFARREDAPVFETVDLNTVIQAAVRLVDASIRKSTSRFEAALAPSLPKVRANARRIEQVVVNLLLNACQALPERSRGISIVTCEAPERGLVLLRVRDEGVGIPPEHLAHLTDPFFTTKRETGGTGLGLSVSAAIVKEHGGALEFTSTPGAGTTVTLSLAAAAEVAAS